MKVLKDLTIWLLLFTMVFMVVYVILLSVDAEYEVNQERERVYFNKIKENVYER